MSALSLSGLGKSFGQTVALDDVSLTIERGSVHALLGENGAGKSTLLSIVAGLYAPDRGTMALSGRPFSPSSPDDARRGGVAIVPQEPTLALSMTVRENVTLGREPTRLGLVDRKAGGLLCRRALARLGADIDPEAELADLRPADRQLVAIARALAQAEPRVVILDEPTSSLAAKEAELVLAAVGELRKGGAAVLYVSHHLPEVRQVADRVTVLRAGRVVHDSELGELSVHELADLIVGRSLARSQRNAREPGEVLLEVESLVGVRLPKRASFQLRRGEILGIAGLVGSGRTELVRALFGLDAVKSGRVRLAGLDAQQSPRGRLAAGLGLISEDRKGEGLMLPMSVSDNVTITHLPGWLGGALVSRKRQGELTQKLIERLGIRARGPASVASSLSGGNQQKVAIARLLFADVDVFLLDEPTRGIDPQSREAIYQLFDELAAAGKAVLWISSQLEELMRVCDRVAFMSRGELGASEPMQQHDEASLLARAGGG